MCHFAQKDIKKKEEHADNNRALSVVHLYNYTACDSL